MINWFNLRLWEDYQLIEKMWDVELFGYKRYKEAFPADLSRCLAQVEWLYRVERMMPYPSRKIVASLINCCVCSKDATVQGLELSFRIEWNTNKPKESEMGRTCVVGCWVTMSIVLHILLEHWAGRERRYSSWKSRKDNSFLDLTTLTFFIVLTPMITCLWQVGGTLSPIVELAPDD